MNYPVSVPLEKMQIKVIGIEAFNLPGIRGLLCTGDRCIIVILSVCQGREHILCADAQNDVNRSNIYIYILTHSVTVGLHLPLHLPSSSRTSHICSSFLILEA
jgi:hypothetical protein